MPDRPACHDVEHRRHGHGVPRCCDRRCCDRRCCDRRCCDRRCCDRRCCDRRCCDRPDDQQPVTDVTVVDLVVHPAVEVGQVRLDGGAQLGEVEPRVAPDQRVERPGDRPQPAGGRPLPLVQLEGGAGPEPTGRGSHRRQVRVQGGAVVLREERRGRRRPGRRRSGPWRRHRRRSRRRAREPSAGRPSRAAAPTRSPRRAPRQPRGPRSARGHGRRPRGRPAPGGRATGSRAPPRAKPATSGVALEGSGRQGLAGSRRRLRAAEGSPRSRRPPGAPAPGPAAAGRPRGRR